MVIEKKKIICIVGASGSGKDTILKLLLNKYEILNRMTSVTTRPVRKGNSNFNEHEHVSDEKFLQLLSGDRLAEHRRYDIYNQDGTVGVWHYGHIKPVENFNITACPIEVYMNFYKNLHDKFDIIGIFLILPEELRLTRMIERETRLKNPNYLELSRRFLSDYNKYSRVNLITKYKIQGSKVDPSKNPYPGYPPHECKIVDNSRDLEEVFRDISDYIIKFLY